MGDLLRLSDYRKTETAALLRALTISATAGDVLDVQVRVRTRKGEMVFSTGAYRVTEDQPHDIQLDAH